MLNFSSDYIEGCHPKILEQLSKTNMIPTNGYGDDDFCKSAREKICSTCGIENLQIEFLMGGTQTNQLTIDTILKPWEGVVSAVTGHVATHEAGAIEYTGHKVLTVPNHLGKIYSTELDDFLNTFFSDGNHEHMVFPGMVYISQPTEYGTIYSKKELTDISNVCKKYSLPLYMDGARLGYALMSKQNDLTLNDICNLVDIFYIGGTKVGALCGEALVFTKNNRPEHFVNQQKKHGALLAKGRLLGLQFDTLFTDGLYLEISKHAIDMADYLKENLAKKGVKFFIDSPTNQQFVILPNKKLDELKKNVSYSFWEKFDDSNTVIRFATSWATQKENIDKLLELI